MATPPHHFEVLTYLKDIHSRHGISEEQHIRYRQYCTRRLHRVRTAKDVKLGVKGGKKYTKQELTAESITTPKHLTISLLLAERAWAFANEDQLNIESPLDENNGKDEKYLRHHITRRFKRAVQHAKEFESLCEATADEYTQLQAHFYSHWMQGVKHIHDSQLEDALKSFTTAKSILTGFADHVNNNVELTAICVDRLQSVNSYLNFCNSRLKRAGADVTALTLSLTTQDPTLLAKLTVLREKALDQADKTSKLSGADDDVVQFGSATFEILNIKVKHWLVEAKALYGSYFAQAGTGVENDDGNGGDDNQQNNQKYIILSTIQSHYDSAVIQLNQDLKQAEIAYTRSQTSSTEDAVRNIKGVLTYISCLKFEVMFSRHYLQLIDLMYKYDIKQSIGIKTIYVMIDRLGHIIKQGIDLYDNNEHFFTSTSAGAQTVKDSARQQSRFKSSLESILASLQLVQKYYGVSYYFSVLASQFTAFEANTPVIQPKDFAIDEFTSIPTLSQRAKVILALVKTNNAAINTVIANIQKQQNDSTTAFGHFALITNLESTAQWVQLFQTKLGQLITISSQTKVIYYSTVSSSKNTTTGTSSATAAASTSLFAQNDVLLMDRLDKFQLGPSHSQYHVFSLIPPTQPIPAKPFVFDSAYGLIVSDNEYYIHAQKQSNEQQQQQQQQQEQSNGDNTSNHTASSPQEQQDDAPKSFWSRLWG